MPVIQVYISEHLIFVVFGLNSDSQKIIVFRNFCSKMPPASEATGQSSRLYDSHVAAHLVLCATKAPPNAGFGNSRSTWLSLTCTTSTLLKAHGWWWSSYCGRTCCRKFTGSRMKRFCTLTDSTSVRIRNVDLNVSHNIANAYWAPTCMHIITACKFISWRLPFVSLISLQCYLRSAIMAFQCCFFYVTDKKGPFC